jgi:arylsulfatase A-like enzyme
MRRRAVVLVAALTLSVALPAAAEAEDTRPSFLVIVSDDQASSMFTRNLMPTVFSQLVDQGVNFTRGYVNTPQCCPSRAEMLTGLYQHHNRVIFNETPLRFPTIAVPLQAAGYRTMLAGKYLNSHDCSPLPEWTRWACLASGPSTYTKVNPLVNLDGTWTQETGLTGSLLASHVGDFLAEDTTSPFFVWYAVPTPHTPQDDPRYKTLPVASPVTPNYNEDTSDKPLYMRRDPLTPTQQWNWASEWNRMARNVRAFDDDVKQLLAALGPRASNTVVIYISDNGWLSGEHRRRGKGTPYEESIRVPFVVRFPPSGSGSRTSSALVLNVDIASTITEMAGVPWVDDGLSLVPLLNGSVSAVRDAALVSICVGSAAICPPGGKNVLGQGTAPGYWAVVGPVWKYVQYGNGEKELYNLVWDPYELTNSVGRYPNVVKLMQLRLAQLKAAPPS